MSDYKDMIQEKVDELAFEEFGKDYYELLKEDQYRIYDIAMDLTNDVLVGMYSGEER